MVNINRLIMIAVLSIALVAIGSVANAAPTFKVDKVQINGNYIGVPKLLDGHYPVYGYSYDFFPDGTYTLYGTFKNDDARNNTTLMAMIGSNILHGLYAVQMAEYPAASTNSITITFKAPSKEDLILVWITTKEGEAHEIDLNNIDFVNAPDNITHTIDQGPMSDSIAIFTNGKLNYNGSPQYTISLGQ